MTKRKREPEFVHYRYVNRHGLIKTSRGGGVRDIVEFLARDDAHAEFFLFSYAQQTGQTLEPHRPLEVYRYGTPEYDEVIRSRTKGEG